MWKGELKCLCAWQDKLEVQDAVYSEQIIALLTDKSISLIWVQDIAHKELFYWLTKLFECKIFCTSNCSVDWPTCFLLCWNWSVDWFLTISHELFKRNQKSIGSYICLLQSSFNHCVLCFHSKSSSQFHVLDSRFISAQGTPIDKEQKTSLWPSVNKLYAYLIPALSGQIPAPKRSTFSPGVHLQDI